DARAPPGSCIALRSAPAQNVPWAPVRTATCRDSSASKRRKASASSAAVGRSIALATSGRSIVTIATRRCASKWIATESLLSGRALGGIVVDRGGDWPPQHVDHPVGRRPMLPAERLHHHEPHGAEHGGARQARLDVVRKFAGLLPLAD